MLDSLYDLISSHYYFFLLTGFILTFCVYRFHSYNVPLPYPPGPKPRNFVTGNWGQFPTREKSYLKYIEWGKQCGQCN